MKQAALSVFALLELSLPAMADGLKVDSVTGVYKSRYKEDRVDGSSYQAEDVLELVKVTPTQVYLRTHLNFYNGHTCGISGIANVEGDTLVYRPKGEMAGCVLSLKRDGKSLIFHDASGACREQNCGTRGSFEGSTFALSARRPIRYMKILLASDQYATAIAERDAKH